MAESKIGGERLKRRIVATVGGYTGNGTSQDILTAIDGEVFQPFMVEIIDITSVVYRSIKLIDMPGDDFLRSQNSVSLRGNSVVYETTNGITITSTGFSVGSSPAINNNGNSYRWMAWGYQ